MPRISGLETFRRLRVMERDARVLLFSGYDQHGHVQQAMKDGALGMSTGLIYVPGTYAETEELVALAEVVGRHGGLYASHMRDEADGVLLAIDEALG